MSGRFKDAYGRSKSPATWIRSMLLILAIICEYICIYLNNPLMCIIHNYRSINTSMTLQMPTIWVALHLFPAVLLTGKYLYICINLQLIYRQFLGILFKLNVTESKQ